MQKETYKSYIKLITYTVILLLLALNFGTILNLLGKGFSMLTPIWIGLIFAYILNIPMSLIEKYIFNGQTNKRIRTISLILSILLIIIFLLVIMLWIMPDFIESATYLIGQVPALLSNLNDLLGNLLGGTPLSTYLTDGTISNEITSVITNIVKSVALNITSIISDTASFIVSFVTGIVIAIYFLFGKEKLLISLNKFIDKIFDIKLSKKINRIGTLCNKSFHDFISYQLLECIILGILMFIAFSIFRFPYALTLAALTAITAIIPILGATIACVIGAILIGTISIKEAVIFVIVFQIVQQIENNLIYPRVVGKHVGLPGVLTIIALVIGGKLGGFLGMLLCIPLMSVVYSLFKEFMNRDTKVKIRVPSKRAKESD